MFHEFSDYHGPSGAYVATGTKIVPFGTVVGTAAVAQSAMLTSLGTTAGAALYEQGMQQSLVRAHELDSFTFARRLD
jgi:hypothetical protein